MAAIRDRTKNRGTPLSDEGEPLSVAQQQLQQLLRRQLHTREVSVKGALDQSRHYAPAVTFKPLTSEMAGLHSLKQYRTKEEDYSHVDHLRELGLTSEEIELKLACEGLESLLPNPPKRRKIEADPLAQHERMEALNKKITNRKELLKKPTKFAGVHLLSRHAMEIEKSLFLDRGNPLTHLTTEDPQRHVVYPSNVVISDSSSLVVPDSDDSNSSPTPPEVDVSSSASAAGEEEAPPLPLQVVERSRLSEGEIKAIPKFKDYSPGEPSKVLYVKNLHRSVSEKDLIAVFGALKPFGAEVLCIRLLTGRLKGQAFVEFKTQDGADLGIKKVNGFLIKEKPMVISYGHDKRNGRD